MILVDGRFLHHSGIGRHIAGVLAHWPGARGTIALAPGADAPAGWTAAPCAAGMYSLAEQGPDLRRLSRQARATWFPHYAHPWRCGGRWICTVHDVLHLAMPELFPGRIRRQAARLLLTDVRDRAAAVCFVSQFGRDEFHRLVGPPRGTEAVVGNGVDPSWSQPVPPPPPGAPYVVAVGNIKPHKGLRYLLRAMTDPALGELDLVIVGRSDGLRTADTSLADLAAVLGRRCRWTGPVGDAELHTLVAHARALAFPSLYEGFGLPPLEAMAAGVPVVASAIPAVIETCGEAAVLVPPADPAALADGLVRVHCDSALRSALIAAGRSRAAQWEWRDVAARTFAALRTAAML